MRIIFFLLSKIPFAILYPISTGLAFLLRYVIHYRTKVVKENLTKSFPEKSPKEINAITWKFYLNLTDVFVESIKVYTMSPEELKKRVQLNNIDLPENYLKKGQSIIGLTSHLCNWEWLLQACALHTTFTIDGVYKPVHNKTVDDFIYELRSRFGAVPVAMKDVLKHMIRHKNEVRALAMVADQTPPHAEIQYWQTFLNQYTPFYVGGDKLGSWSQRPVFFVEMARIKRGYYEMKFELLKEPPLSKDTHEVTELFVKSLEKAIQRNPSDWLWSHKRWKHKEIKTVKENTTLKA